MYKRRNEVERLFRRLKGFRRIFSRFDKLDAMFVGFLSFVLVADGRFVLPGSRGRVAKTVAFASSAHRPLLSMAAHGSSQRVRADASTLIRIAEAKELPMQDESVLDHITKLVEEEHQLVASGAPGPATQARLKRVEEELDRCWDLLRQRRAKREFGGDPDSARVRETGTVEGYEG